MLSCLLLGGLGIVLGLGLGSGQPVCTHIPGSSAVPLGLQLPTISSVLDCEVP